MKQLLVVAGAEALVHKAEMADLLLLAAVVLEAMGHCQPLREYLCHTPVAAVVDYMLQALKDLVALVEAEMVLHQQT